MKLNISIEELQQNIKKRIFISRDEYESLRYGDVLRMCRYSQSLNCLLNISITISDFFYDEEGNGYVCGYVDLGSENEYYTEKLVAPNIINKI